MAETFRGAILLANMVEGGRTPYLSAGELAALGFKIAIFPVTARPDRGRRHEALLRVFQYGKGSERAARCRCCLFPR